MSELEARISRLELAVEDGAFGRGTEDIEQTRTQLIEWVAVLVGLARWMSLDVDARNVESEFRAARDRFDAEHEQDLVTTLLLTSILTNADDMRVRVDKHMPSQQESDSHG